MTFPETLWEFEMRGDKKRNGLSKSDVAELRELMEEYDGRT